MFTTKDRLGGKYRLVIPLGERDRGAVWRGLDVEQERAVVVATVEPRDGEKAWRIQRFLHTMETVADLEHPNVARVLDFGETDDGGAYAVMEALDGLSLAARLSEEPTLTLGELVDVACGALDGLAELHTAGVVHGAIEPGNIFLLTGSGSILPKLVGVAHSRLIARGGGEAPDDEGFLRSLAYTSPEQARSDVELTPASDLYCFGVVLYESIAGRMPSLGRTADEIRIAVLSASAPTLQSVRPGLPLPLTRVVQRALAAKPESRHDNALTMQRALRSALAALPEELREENLPVGERGVHSPSAVERVTAERIRKATEGTPPQAPTGAGVVKPPSALANVPLTGKAAIKTTLPQWPRKALEEGAEAAAWRVAAKEAPVVPASPGRPPSPEVVPASPGRPPSPEVPPPRPRPAPPKGAAEAVPSRKETAAEAPRQDPAPKAAVAGTPKEVPPRAAAAPESAEGSDEPRPAATMGEDADAPAEVRPEKVARPDGADAAKSPPPEKAAKPAGADAAKSPSPAKAAEPAGADAAKKAPQAKVDEADAAAAKKATGERGRAEAEPEEEVARETMELFEGDIDIDELATRAKEDASGPPPVPGGGMGPSPFDGEDGEDISFDEPEGEDISFDEPETSEVATPSPGDGDGGSPPEVGDRTATDGDYGLPEPTDAPTGSLGDAATEESPAATRRRPNPLLVGIAALVLLGAVGGIVALVSLIGNCEGERDTAGVGPSSASLGGEGDSGETVPAADGGGDGATTGDGAPSPAEDGAAPEASAAPATAVITLTGVPRRGIVRVDGERVRGRTIELPVDGVSREITVQAPGRVVWSRQLQPTEDVEIAVELARLRRPPRWDKGPGRRRPRGPTKPGGAGVVRSPGF